MKSEPTFSVLQPSNVPAASHRSSELADGRRTTGESELPDGLFIGDAFIDVLLRSWEIRNNRQRGIALSPRSVGQTYLHPVLTSICYKPRNILATLGQKYDQYLDFRQQDAHEFLSQLLDAMRMEEIDVGL